MNAPRLDIPKKKCPPKGDLNSFSGTLRWFQTSPNKWYVTSCGCLVPSEMYMEQKACGSLSSSDLLPNSLLDLLAVLRSGTSSARLMHYLICALFCLAMWLCDVILKNSADIVTTILKVRAAVRDVLRAWMRLSYS